MGAYLLSLIGGMAIGYLNKKPREILVWSAVVILATIVAAFAMHLHLSHGHLKGYVPFLSRLGEVDIEQLLFGFLLGVVIGRGLRFYIDPESAKSKTVDGTLIIDPDSAKSKPVDRSLIYPVAVLVVLGLILPAVPWLARLSDRLTGVSLPFGSIAFSEQEAPKTPGATVFRDPTNAQFGKAASQSSTSDLFRSFANQKRGMGNIHRDLAYIELSNPEAAPAGLKRDLRKLNDFVVEVVQPVGACMELIRSRTGATYPIKKYVSEMIRLLRQTVEDTDGATWERFQRQYLLTQVQLVRDIREQRILVDEGPSQKISVDRNSSDMEQVSPLAACNFVIPVLKYTKNPFRNEHWPYGTLTLAVLLDAAGETDAALAELARWLDYAATMKASGDNTIPSWMTTRAKIYLFELLSKESGRDAFYLELVGKIREDYEMQFAIPHSANALRRAAADDCKDMSEDLKHILFSYMSYVNDELVAIVRSPAFPRDIVRQERARQLTEYLSLFPENCFDHVVEEDVIMKYAAEFYTSIARTFVALARINEQQGGYLDPRDDDLLIEARALQRRALPILKEIAKKQESKVEYEADRAPYTARLHASEREGLQYETVLGELDQLERAIERASQ